jgi:hypothetical protein
MELRENLSDGERKMMSLHDFILSAFRREFGDTVIGVNLLPLVHECWATVVVKEKSHEIEKMVSFR